MSKTQDKFAQDQRLAQAERLVQLRRNKGLTAEQLAQAMTEAGARVSRGAISNWERGTNGIVSSKLPTLARLLGCTEGYLLRGDNDSDGHEPNPQSITTDQNKPSLAHGNPSQQLDTQSNF